MRNRLCKMKTDNYVYVELVFPTLTNQISWDLVCDSPPKLKIVPVWPIGFSFKPIRMFWKVQNVLFAAVQRFEVFVCVVWGRWTSYQFVLVHNWFESHRCKLHLLRIALLCVAWLVRFNMLQYGEAQRSLRRILELTGSYHFLLFPIISHHIVAQPYRYSAIPHCFVLHCMCTHCIVSVPV